MLLCAARHIYSALSGFLLIYYPFGSGVFNALVPAFFSYLAMLRFREHAGTLTWLTSFGYLLWWCGTGYLSPLACRNRPCAVL